MQVSASDVDAEGFTLDVESWAPRNTDVRSVQAQWVAVGVCVGMFGQLRRRGALRAGGVLLRNALDDKLVR